MSTTTIRLPEELKARVERLVAASGGTAHAFMVEAVAEATEQREQRDAFHAEAGRRMSEMQRTGEFLTHDDLRAYAMGLARGEKPEPPVARVMTSTELARFRGRSRRLKSK